MVIHLMPDDKFIDTIIQMVEASGTDTVSRFLVRGKQPFKYVTNQLAEAMPLDDPAFRLLMNTLTPDDKVIIHYLGGDICNWLLDYEPKARIYWGFWGSEFFEISGADIPLYDTLTQKNIDDNFKQGRLSFIPFVRKRRLKQYKDLLLRDMLRRRERFSKVLDKIDVLLHYNQHDHQLILKHFPSKLQFQYFNYPPAYTYAEMDKLIQDVALPVEMVETATNVWIGNSAYPSNNHLDVFDNLRGKINDQTFLWVPLSYGDEAYRQNILKQGYQMFGSQFKPVTNYMTFVEYAAMLSKMDVAIMGHIRQQAFGNIQMLFYFGSVVYMHPNSTLMTFLQEQGYHLKNITHGIDIDVPGCLSAEQLAINKKLIVEQFDKSCSSKYIAELAK